MIIIYAQILANLIIATILWTISKKIDKVSFVDSMWSIFFIIASSLAAFLQPGSPLNMWLIFVPLLLWSSRLTLHITIRNWNKGEDVRYLKLKQKYGRYPAWALWIVFWPQALLACFINWPLSVALVQKNEPQYYLLIFLGIALFTIGFIIESIADIQLLHFQKNRKDKNEILNQGLWAWSRHPNYFGESLLWWGFYCISLGITGQFLTILSPLLMTFLLLKVSGVTMLDKVLQQSKPRYVEYMKKTNAFFPWPPKK